ncbi:tellurite resistance/C4-dicarboxylate transporter family protein [Streptomyces sp. NPDC127108]|uniref:tellurite resistance/C4-dicarboxylate transporter family protein n=1 Tax=Streptomyces sp. NPDC127108 TaxID=3345361 RepID=UPI00363D70F1
MRRALADRCRGLAPACFAPVMATGIVSRALAQTGARALSLVLFGIATALYVVLLCATALKARYHRAVVRAELGDPTRLFGHFTLVAASGVLAARLDSGPARVAGCALLVVAAVVWAVLAHAIARLRGFGSRTILRQADGTWFLAAVGLQALVLTLVGLRPGRPVVTLALGLWVCGVVLYAVTLAAVVRRLRYDPPPPARLAPSYWVTMGAAAISTLAGARLLAHDGLLPAPVRAPLGGTVVALWTWATFLIPLLLATGVWRHLHHRVPLAYEPTLWCIVFPLGMYATATAQLAAAQRVGALSLPQRPLAWAAMAAWLAVGARWATGRASART